MGTALAFSISQAVSSLFGNGFAGVSVKEGWAFSGKVRIHYLDSDPAERAAEVPLLLIPGMLGSGEDYLVDMKSLAPRRCISVSLRGRGNSDAPEQGYSFEDHIVDVEAVVNATGLSGFCTLGHSVGVSYAIGYAFRHPDSLQGLVLLDYPACYPAFGPKWVDRALSTISDQTRAPAMLALQRESVEVPLWQSWSESSAPYSSSAAARRGPCCRRTTRRSTANAFPELGPSSSRTPGTNHGIPTETDTYTNSERSSRKSIPGSRSPS